MKVTRYRVAGLTLQTVACVAVIASSFWGETDNKLCEHVISSDLRFSAWMLTISAALWGTILLGAKAFASNMIGRPNVSGIFVGAGISFIAFQGPVCIELVSNIVSDALPRKIKTNSSPGDYARLNGYDCGSASLPIMFLICDYVRWKSTAPEKECGYWDGCKQGQQHSSY